MAARTVVSVMQPYFAPYGGYWRLLAAADLFVIFDDVQFPRRGWVHRNRLPSRSGDLDWLTLPLSPAPYDALIADLRFADDAAARMAERRRAFPGLDAPNPAAEAFLGAGPFEGPLVDYLERQIAFVRDLFGLSCVLTRSSALAIDPSLRAQDRILAILDRVGATDYVNAPGGRALYQAEAFAARGVALHFLPDYAGGHASLLHRLATEPEAAAREAVLAETPDYRA